MDTVDAGRDEPVQGPSRFLEQLGHGLEEIVAMYLEVLLEIAGDSRLDELVDVAAFRRQLLHGLSPARFTESGAVGVAGKLQDGTALMPDVNYQLIEFKLGMDSP